MVGIDDYEVVCDRKVDYFPHFWWSNIGDGMVYGEVIDMSGNNWIVPGTMYENENHFNWMLPINFYGSNITEGWL